MLQLVVGTLYICGVLAARKKFFQAQGKRILKAKTIRRPSLFETKGTGPPKAQAA
jgi:hypothetical protein